MKAVVVYESLWGNTEAVAKAIAEGFGPDATALSTAEATPELVAGADLIVAGAPMQAFSLPGERSRAGIRADTVPIPDLSIPTLRSWLETLPAGHGRSAAFETKIRWSPGSATRTIDTELEKAGYPPLVEAEHFVVTGTYGPLREGELDRVLHSDDRRCDFGANARDEIRDLANRERGGCRTVGRRAFECGHRDSGVELARRSMASRQGAMAAEVTGVSSRGWSTASASGPSSATTSSGDA